jgi:hypothetical protein
MELSLSPAVSEEHCRKPMPSQLIIKAGDTRAKERAQLGIIKKEGITTL